MREHEHEHEQLADLEGADGVEVLLEAVEDALEPISHHETFSKPHSLHTVLLKEVESYNDTSARAGRAGRAAAA